MSDEDYVCDLCGKYEKVMVQEIETGTNRCLACIRDIRKLNGMWSGRESN